MTADTQRAQTELNRRKGRGWILCGVALLSGAAGSLVTAQLTQATNANAVSDRLFELNVYHSVPGKVPALVSRFREAAKLQAKHGLKVIGYWVPYGDPAWNDTFIYIVRIPAAMKRRGIGTLSTPTQSFRNTSDPSRPSR